MERLESDPGPNEREEIQRLLAQIETALSLLEPGDVAERRVIRVRIVSHGAQVVRYAAELPDQLDVAEFGAGRVPGQGECDGPALPSFWDSASAA